MRLEKTFLGVIISDRPCSPPGTFTRNAFVAAPVVVSKEVLAKGRGIARGLVVNSGCANAVTRSKGLKDARAMSDQLDSFVGESNSSSATGTLVMSIGVIGQLLPIKKILNVQTERIKRCNSQAKKDY
ncbi:BZ3500_MvSof-1268-A1-R1_Chr4-2g07107 [Microbotryum saponariae]|uniref:BZ3500_MvSof-1268-A1-R1_Chr4-2g07107 protein n=1 Tax=Microbotryum saponariae TaxID=289078 RepID=A0A2X0MSA7_9BASI|nr:BZ3500_MvSof-1268-A1-R1_Chr4-2g07107 [Microbotryum saponariae]SDA06772.1 BZ3501_MvSof-1269-A2-R1_Chr4-2g06818 [Microbotryum saponariae]